MNFINEIKVFLNKILSSPTKERLKHIEDLQNKIWNDEFIKNETINEILSELAYDLDFYEPDDALRKEDQSYYGDKKLEEIVKKTLKNLNQHKPSN